MGAVEYMKKSLPSNHMPHCSLCPPNSSPRPVLWECISRVNFIEGRRQYRARWSNIRACLADGWVGSRQWILLNDPILFRTLQSAEQSSPREKFQNVDLGCYHR